MGRDKVKIQDPSSKFQGQFDIPAALLAGRNGIIGFEFGQFGTGFFNDGSH
jgi:hypothetical protein